MEKFTPIVSKYALTSKVLVVATTRIDGWCAYIDSVPGMNHQDEMFDVLDRGCKLPEHIAREMFSGVYTDLPYAK